MNGSSIRERYLDAAENFRILVSKEERILWYLSAFRFLSFTGGLAIILLGFSNSKTAGFILIPPVIVLFLFLLELYSVHSKKKEFFGNLAIINRHEAAAVSGDLSHFEAGNAYINSAHDFSNDVDLFGNSSLFQYINRTVTGYGRDILANWLSDPMILSHELTARQEAIRELSDKEKWRHEFMATGMKIPLEKNHITSLLEWMEDSSPVKSNSLKNVLIYILPGAAVLSFFLVISGLLHYSVFTFLFLFNLFYITAGLKKTNKIHRVLSGKYSYLSSLNGLIKSFDYESFNSESLNIIKLNISCNNLSAAASLKKLSRLIQSFDSRMNIMVGFILNGFLLWDYHCIYRLEKWKYLYKEMFPVWLDMIGNVDAYISLGNYACNNPEFVYAQIAEKEHVFSGTNLGHPLIAESIRVCNDFTLARSGNICIISGANMAGKSTFLRTIAVNYILGMSGAPVCASELDFIPMKLYTSMRTTDSLSNNESYFYAELKRLRTLKTMIEKGETVFFILDEILKGTNSADKSAGSKLFLKKMVELNGTGLIATHDTSLGEMEKEFPRAVLNMCFEIEIEGEFIRFDYKLREGITQKMNAALLMKQMGILE